MSAEQFQHANWSTLQPDETLPVKVLSSRDVSVGDVPLRSDRLRMSGGSEVEKVYRPRGAKAVFVLPLTDSGQVVLLREYRHPVRTTITATVAGTLEQGEDVFHAAQRELLEEAGGMARDWVALPAFYPTPSFTGTVYYAFIAFGVQLGENQLMPDETIERIVLPLAEAYRMLRVGEIQDGPSSLVMWHALQELQARGYEL